MSGTPAMEKTVETLCRTEATVGDDTTTYVEEMENPVEHHAHHIDIESVDSETQEKIVTAADEAGVADTEVAVEDLIAEWKTASSREHGPQVHQQVHTRAKVAGRAYMLRWNAHRKRLIAEQVGSGVEDDVGGGKLTGNAQGSHEDEAILASFHAELWREAAQYRHDMQRPGGTGLDDAGWSQDSRDFYTGVLAVDAVLRKAAKVVTGDEHLFAEPPPCLMSS